MQHAEDAVADATPHCDACLAPLDVEGDARRSWWRCPSCGLVRL